jgi:hypothetical protein
VVGAGQKFEILEGEKLAPYVSPSISFSVEELIL